MKKIAIDKNLPDIENYLRNHGYEVEEFNAKNTTTPSYNTKNFTYYEFDRFDAVITADSNKNAIGIPNILTSTPLINAEKLSPEEVEKLINEKTSNY